MHWCIQNHHQKCKKGEVIGCIGQTGNASGVLWEKKSCRKRSSVCRACALFGMAREKSLGSRIRVTDAVLEKPENSTAAYEYHVRAANMTGTKQKRKPRRYTDEFKQQLADLYHSGKCRCNICQEYDTVHSLPGRWVKQAEIFKHALGRKQM